LNLPRLRNVREEREFWRDFDTDRPCILGALLDAAAMALRNEAQTKLEVRVRMADAARWVVAAEPALPWEPGRFIQAYETNRSDANSIVLEASPVAAEIRAFVAGHTSWEGTAAELLSALDTQAPEKTKRLKSWPSTPRVLASAIRRLAPNLRADGIGVELSRAGHDRRRVISLRMEEGKHRPHRPHGPHTSDSEDLDADGLRTQAGDAEDLRPHQGPQSTPRTDSGKDDADDADAEIPTPEEADEGWI
jgi:hypothetical protein